MPMCARQSSRKRFSASVPYTEPMDLESSTEFVSSAFAAPSKPGVLPRSASLTAKPARYTCSVSCRLSPVRRSAAFVFVVTAVLADALAVAVAALDARGDELLEDAGVAVPQAAAVTLSARIAAPKRRAGNCMRVTPVACSLDHDRRGHVAVSVAEIRVGAGSIEREAEGLTCAVRAAIERAVGGGVVEAQSARACRS